MTLDWTVIFYLINTFFYVVKTIAVSNIIHNYESFGLFILRYSQDSRILIKALRIPDLNCFFKAIYLKFYHVNAASNSCIKKFIELIFFEFVIKGSFSTIWTSNKKYLNVLPLRFWNFCHLLTLKYWTKIYFFVKSAY